MPDSQKSLFDKTNRSGLRGRKVSAPEAGVKTITICGVGLIGGSIAERVKSKNKSLCIIGYDRKATTDKARGAGIIDHAETSFKKILSESDLIVLSANPSSNESILRRLSRCMCETSALIIDTGSMQSGIAELARSLAWKNGASFVSGHPMAGRETQGLQNRRADLFVDHPFFFDEATKLEANQTKRLSWLTGALGSYPMFVDSKTHDRIMTDISQIPQLLSTLIGAFVLEHDKQTIHLAGTGLQSMIRLGGSPYSNWHDVFIENGSYLSSRLRVLIHELQRIEQSISSAGDIGEHFKRAQRSYACLW